MSGGRGASAAGRGGRAGRNLKLTAVEDAALVREGLAGLAVALLACGVGDERGSTSG